MARPPAMNEVTLESLRAQGAHRHDAARFHYLEVLSRRMQTQPQAVRQILDRRLSAALADYAERASAAAAPPVAADKALSAGCELAQLNRELSARTQSEADGVLLGDGASMSDMKSVRQFSEVWSKISAEQQIVKALDRGAENAGPLNSHKLMLRSLALMRSLSPDYLRRFLSQMDSLLWLEAVNTRPARAPATRQGRSGRAKP
jgi:hypothetical protein